MWLGIGCGYHSGGAYTIDLTDNGRYPAGTFSLIRLTLDGATNKAESDLLLRVNADDTPGLHQYGLNVRDFSNGPLPPAHGDDTAWRVAQWHKTQCTAEVTIIGTKAALPLPYLSRGARLSGSSGSHRQSEGSGRLTDDRLIHSLEVDVDAPSTTFSHLLWWAEGWVSRTEVINAWEGVPSHDAAPVVARVTGTHARLAVWNDANLDGDPTFYDAPVSAQGVARFTATGLGPDTDYWWQIEVDHQLDTSITGTFRTLPTPGTPHSFTIAAAGCASGADSTAEGAVLAPNQFSNHPVFDTIREFNPLFFAHLGDWAYPDPGRDPGRDDIPAGAAGATVEIYRRIFDDLLLQPRQSALYQRVPLWLGDDDHDRAYNNHDKTFPWHANYLQAHRERVPVLPDDFPSATANYRARRVGRVLFAMADVRSARSPNTDPDDASKTMLGIEQRIWLRSLLESTDAKALVWFMPSPWHGNGRTDSWDDFTTERDWLIDMFDQTGWLDRMCIVGGDMHALAIDTGGNSPGGIPTFQFASLDSNFGTPQSGYDTGPTQPGNNQWGTVQITDDGTDITVTGVGRIGAGQWASHAFVVQLA